MKKTYITPNTCAICLDVAEMLAASVLNQANADGSVDNNININTSGEYGGDFRSQKRGWSSDLWNE